MDSRKCQTPTASPAEPGELPIGLATPIGELGAQPVGRSLRFGLRRLGPVLATWILWVILIVLFVAFYNFFSQGNEQVDEPAFTQLLSKVEKKEVRAISIKGNVYSGEYADSKSRFRTTGPVADTSTLFSAPAKLVTAVDCNASFGVPRKNAITPTIKPGVRWTNLFQDLALRGVTLRYTPMTYQQSRK